MFNNCSCVYIYIKIKYIIKYIMKIIFIKINHIKYKTECRLGGNLKL